MNEATLKFEKSSEYPMSQLWDGKGNTKSSQENLQENLQEKANSMPTQAPTESHKSVIVQSSPDEFSASQGDKFKLLRNDKTYKFDINPDVLYDINHLYSL